MRMGEQWYRGTADSVFQNLHLVDEFRADAILVFGADHIYKMNIRQMTDFHHAKNCGGHDRLSAGSRCARPASSESSRPTTRGRVVGSRRNRSDPITIPGDPEHCLASMGNYALRPGR